MKKVLLGSLFYLTSCAMVQTTAGPGLILTQAKDMVLAVETDRPATKQGIACLENILGAVVSGDASIDAAKREGRITKVATVDREVYSVLGIYARSCTVVTGN